MRSMIRLVSSRSLSSGVSGMVHKQNRFRFDDRRESANLTFTALQDERYLEHATWVGIIISLWTQVEQELSFIYGGLLGLDHTRSQIAFYAIQNHHTKRNIISAVIAEHHAGTELETRWSDVQERIRRCYRQRNIVAHGLWDRHPSKNQPRITTTSVDGVSSRKDSIYSANTLGNQAYQISQLASELSGIALLVHEPPSSL